MNGGAEPALKIGLTGITISVRNRMFLRKTFCGTGHLGSQMGDNLVGV